MFPRVNVIKLFTAPTLPAKIRLGCKGIVREKHSSLLRKSVNYDRKKFCGIGPRWLSFFECMLFFLNMPLQRILTKQEEVPPLFVEKHLTERHFSDATIGYESFGSQTMGQHLYGWNSQVCGRQNRGLVQKHLSILCRPNVCRRSDF